MPSAPAGRPSSRTSSRCSRPATSSRRPRGRCTRGRVGLTPERGACDVLCALTVRQLKPDTFDAFVEAFTPSQDEGPPSGWVRFNLLRDTSDPNRVVTFGFFDGTREELEGSQVDHSYAERREGANQYVADVPVNGVFD